MAVICASLDGMGDLGDVGDDDGWSVRWFVWSFIRSDGESIPALRAPSRPDDSPDRSASEAARRLRLGSPKRSGAREPGTDSSNVRRTVSS